MSKIDQVDELLINLYKHMDFLRWRKQSYDNGTETLTTFADDKEICLIFDEFNDIFIKIQCLLLHEVNKQALHYHNKEMAKKILKEVMDKQLGDWDLYRELNRYFKSHSIVER